MLPDDPDDRGAEDFERAVPRLQRLLKERYGSAVQYARIHLPAEDVILPGVGADILRWRGPGLAERDTDFSRPFVVAFGTTALWRRPIVNELALSLEVLVDRPLPFRRPDLLDQIFDLGEPVEIDRSGVDEIGKAQKLGRLENCEHADDFTDVAGKSQDVVAVVGKSRPLRLVLARRIPQKGIANGRVRGFDVVGNEQARRRSEVEAGQPVEDHPDGVETARPPWRPRQRSASSACDSANTRRPRFRVELFTSSAFEGSGARTAAANGAKAASLANTVPTATSRSLRKLWKSTIPGPPSIR